MSVSRLVIGIREIASRRGKTVAIVVAAFSLVAALAAVTTRAEPTPRGRLEARLAARGMRLVVAPFALGERDAAVRVSFTPQTLRTHEPYLVHPTEPEEYWHVGRDGVVEHTGRVVGRLDTSGALLLTRSSLTLFLDDAPRGQDFLGWRLYWATATNAAPPVESLVYPAVDFRDSLMREAIANDNWVVSSGTWEMTRHGAGLAADERHAGAARAVNPFSAIGRDSGVLSCAAGRFVHAEIEARFYFGIPKTGPVADINTLPTGTDMLVVVGPPGGEQVSFGWRGRQRRFAIARRDGDGDGEWNVLRTYEGPRPPITNWVRIGLRVEHGHAVAGLLDGVVVERAKLSRMVAGPCHIACGSGAMEFDDVRACSIPVTPEEPAPLRIASRHFGSKKIADPNRDPAQFGEWAHGSRTFASYRDDKERLSFIVGRRVLFGDFLYRSVPHAHGLGRLPTGAYELRVLRKSSADRAKADEHEKVFAARFERTDKGWRALDLDPGVWPEGHEEFTLRLRRASADGNRLAVEVDGTYMPVSPPIDGPVHLAVGRAYGADGDKTSPSDEHHEVLDSHLVHELFEEAATGWSWVDGRFRMDSRWACSNQWNFMACGSTGVPMMVSKRTFGGDQEHDLFMSLRSAMPWDAGDADYVYDVAKDRHGWKVFVKNKGWYNRHDLNFSFCCNGRDPLSGYALVFAGEDNSETRLMRKGEVVARTKKSRHLIPLPPGHGNIHWLWWHFSVCRIGPDIRVYHNDTPVLSYSDPEPLQGGHLAVWSIRNAFIVARMSSSAQRLGEDPHVLYIPPSVESTWKPLVTDTVSLGRHRPPRSTTVTLNTGAGFHAVRHVFDAPVDLRETPVLRLPLRIPRRLKLNLHVSVSGRSYILHLSAPLSGMKAYLTPEHERGEQFLIPTIAHNVVRSRALLGTALPDGPDGEIRVDLLARIRALPDAPAEPLLECITIGNTSNAEYLLAGGDGNTAGSSYDVGTPTMHEAGDSQ